MTDRSVRPPMPMLGDALLSPDVMLRVGSLVLAAGVGLALLLAPHLLAGDAILVQIILPVMLVGMMAALVHGLGYRPRSTTVSIMLGPWVSWPLMLSSLALLVFRVG